VQARTTALTGLEETFATRVTIPDIPPADGQGHGTDSGSQRMAGELHGRPRTPHGKGVSRHRAGESPERGGVNARNRNNSYQFLLGGRAWQKKLKSCAGRTRQ
jgi:hypothetical protein